MSGLDERSADLMPCVFNLGALNPALAAILSMRPACELDDLCSGNEPKSVNFSLETPSFVPLFLTLVFDSEDPRKISSVLLLLGGSETDLDPTSSPNIADKKVLGLGLGGTQSPIITTLSSIPAILTNIEV